MAIDKLMMISGAGTLSYGVQMKFMPKVASKMYWKEGERNNIDTVQSGWLGTVLLGSGALQVMSALDGECTKNQMGGAALAWAVTLPEYVAQRDDFKGPMLYANTAMATALTAVLVKSYLDKRDK
ncbi:predicted protein [Ostreococcus lucimarinus CCE9901]|uniref:Uncharacterized protein n=2 Tax=Ostreococcus sp. 'lucimarinus' TaxID=242159 RepID=A4S555_OSTLU|nr:predicted protein [Ostreococcus lucimarinus CCE9901]ABO98676.1 predicted protein [Ostreococcus lucimarinus CCE9901]|mmetsp:Transcript_209/g.789  ORF Transcript_209/g.789 Transcript_209/m.789 type:complete len:125 (+) Transcript_209:43-417(+)|eukprot:XP_001420383.1 predicted protein [Ostreococcus lucimarinus CCE9901]